MGEERFLQERQPAVAVAEALDRLDPAALDLAHGDETGAGLPFVEQHGAGAAVARVATDLGAGESEVVAQRRRQPRDRRTAPLGRPAVQGERDLHDAKPRSRRRSTVTTASLRYAPLPPPPSTPDTRATCPPSTPPPPP